MFARTGFVTLGAFCLGACTGVISEPNAGDGNASPPDVLTVSPNHGSPLGGDESGAGGDTGATENIWSPAPGTSWQWQLTGTPDLSVEAEVFDLDLFEASDSTLAELTAQDRIIVCYFSAGSQEEWREDAAQFPSEAVGEPLDGWPDERWVDIRHPAVREVMLGRLDLAAARGCDAVEPDNIDGYIQDSGFSLTYVDQIAYNRFLASEAHDRGLSIGLKNDVDQVAELVDDFDWALNEECMQYDECETLTPFIDAGKAVFHVEYGSSEMSTEVCPRALDLQFDTLIKRLDLDAWRVACS